jgi:hypothetical protein
MGRKFYRRDSNQLKIQALCFFFDPKRQRVFILGDDKPLSLKRIESARAKAEETETKN